MLDMYGESRQQRGLEIPATAKIERKGRAWLVPSQSGKGRYSVFPDIKTPRCTCLDNADGGFKCKHLFAVEYVIQRDNNLDGSTTVTETMTVQETVRRVYPQDWRSYNAAQTNEKAKFQELLRDLCSGVAELPQPKSGRPRLPIQDALFSAVFKIYSTVSGRRFMTDLREAKAKGFITKTPHFNSIFNYLENPELTPVLQNLITESSLPLKAIEVDFAVDSSGFSTSRFTRWFDHKYGEVRQEHDWIKCHLMCGVRTHIVTAVEIKHKNTSDTQMLPALVDATAKNFNLSEVSADKAYGSRSNYKAIELHGATPYITFKKTRTGGGSGMWQKMFHYYNFNRDQFLRHYHKRSNVESTFSMIKAKFRDHVRSKTDVSMKNEVLCKIICHNICCLIQESYELGISTIFWAETSPAQKQALN